MEQLFHEGYDPVWVLGRDKGPPFETKSKPPAPKPDERKPSPIETKPKQPAPNADDRKPSPIELKVPMCCELCAENVLEALRELDGVDSVKVERAAEKVTITGNVKPKVALLKAKKVSRRSEFWPKKKEEITKIDLLLKTGTDNVKVVRKQRSEVEKLRTEHSSLLEESRDLAQEERGGSREENADLAGPKLDGVLLSGLFSRSAGSKTEHGPVRLEENSLERVASPVLQPVSAPQTTSESNQPRPFVPCPATPNRGPLPSPAPSPSARSPASLHPYARSAITQSDVDTPYLPSPSDPSQASSLPQVGLAQSQYNDGIHSNVQATAGQLHPVCNDSATSAPGTSSVDDLIKDVENRREDGYFLSSEWLLGLEQKQRETLMLILSRAGLSETYHSGMTILFERIENDLHNLIDGSNPSSVVTKNVICNKCCQQVEALEEGDAVEDLSIDHSPGIATSHHSEYLPETSGDVPIAVTTLMVEDSSQIRDPLPQPMVMDELMSLDEKGHEKCMTNSTNVISLEQKPTTLKSFLTALKSSHHHSYAVSTRWLAHLEDHEKKELETIILEAGYTRMHQDSNTTTFERIRDNVGFPPSNLCNNPTETSDKTNVGACDIGKQEFSGTGGSRGGLLRNDRLEGKFNHEDTTTETFGLVAKSRTEGEKSRCRPQILKVTCSSLHQTVSTVPTTFLSLAQNSTVSRASSSRGPNRRQQVGDSVVILPHKDESHTISTTMERPFSMTKIEVDAGKSTLSEVCVTLKAIVTTTIGCCLRVDEDSAKIRFKVSKIHGEVTTEGSQEQRCNALVLSSLRTNVYACINNEESEGESDEIVLQLEDEYFVSPRQRVVGDNVWLKLSEISPKNCESGSITLELQGDVRRRSRNDFAAQVQRAHVLHFQEPRPVVLEGDIPQTLNPKLFVEFNVRYQLEISYNKPRTPILKEAHFVPISKTSEVIDFDCCLNFISNKFRFD